MTTPLSLFDPVAGRSVVDAVVAQFEAAIVAGVLKQGVKLPPERQLAQSLNVSREKLRQAAAQLEARGLLEARQGDGTYVADLIGSALSPAMIDLLARHERGVRDYLEFRRDVEGFAASLAAERATAQDRAAIAASIERQEEAMAAGDAQAILDEDPVFHAAVIDASHNAVVAHTMTSIYDLTRRGIIYSRTVLAGVEGANEALCAQHRVIAAAVERGDPEAARAASERHIDYVSDALQRAAEREMREAVSARRSALAR